MKSALPTLRMQSDDGCLLAVRQLKAAPRADAPVLLLLHALAMDGSMWAAVADELPGHLHVYAMDCRGHGMSGKPRGPYTIERLARDTAMAISGLGRESVHLAGCSMGGTVAIGTAARFRRRVASLALVDTTASYGPGAPAAWNERACKAEAQGMASLVPFQSERWFSEEFRQARPEVLHASISVFLANDVAAYAASCRMLGDADERRGLANYHGPAVVMVGEHDYATPAAMAQALADALPAARLVTIPGARHYTPLERPDIVAHYLAENAQMEGTA